MTDRAALLQLRDRLAKAPAGSYELDEAIHQIVLGLPPTGTAGPRPYSHSIDAAVTLFGPEWLLVNLSDIAADGLSLAKFVTTESPCREATGIGGRTLPLTICLARIEYELAKTEPT